MDLLEEKVKSLGFLPPTISPTPSPSTCLPLALCTKGPKQNSNKSSVSSRPDTASTHCGVLWEWHAVSSSWCTYMYSYVCTHTHSTSPSFHSFNATPQRQTQACCVHAKEDELGWPPKRSPLLVSPSWSCIVPALILIKLQEARLGAQKRTPHPLSYPGHI